jgi:DNA invertase Pin-like site-specific DNA recombinase
VGEVISEPAAAGRTRQPSAPPRWLGDPSGRRRAGERPPPGAAPRSGVAVVGYASVSGPAGTVTSEELKRQADVIARECERRGLALLEMVGEREPANGKALERPGLRYALERIAARETQGLVVSELSQLTRSAADLGSIIEWFERAGARLIAGAHALDTEDESGRLAASILIEVSGWERERISQRTRNGLEAARLNGRAAGRPAVSDNPDLRDRIHHMRSQGMTLQAIADALNEDGVPTVRGGAKWRHSSVQAAAGYKRPTNKPPRDQLPAPDPPRHKDKTTGPQEGEPWAA